MVSNLYMMILIIALFLFIFSLNTYANIIPIEDWQIPYYKQAFKDAWYYEINSINDPLTEFGPNSEILNIYDGQYKFLGIIREVSTNTGCGHYCAPLEFTLAITSNQHYYKLLTYDPLMKLGHIEFTSENYHKLHQILTTPPRSYSYLTGPEDMIDATTGATKLSLKNDVVKTAAFSCFRIYEYLKQTLNFLNN